METLTEKITNRVKEQKPLSLEEYTELKDLIECEINMLPSGHKLQQLKECSLLLDILKSLNSLLNFKHKYN